MISDQLWFSIIIRKTVLLLVTAVGVGAISLAWAVAVGVLVGANALCGVAVAVLFSVACLVTLLEKNTTPPTTIMITRQINRYSHLGTDRGIFSPQLEQGEQYKKQSLMTTIQYNNEILMKRSRSRDHAT